MSVMKKFFALLISMVKNAKKDFTRPGANILGVWWIPPFRYSIKALNLIQSFSKDDKIQKTILKTMREKYLWNNFAKN